jgi:hypothetical protein
MKNEKFLHSSFLILHLPNGFALDCGALKLRLYGNEGGFQMKKSITVIAVALLLLVNNGFALARDLVLGEPQTLRPDHETGIHMNVSFLDCGRIWVSDITSENGTSSLWLAEIDNEGGVIDYYGNLDISRTSSRVIQLGDTCFIRTTDYDEPSGAWHSSFVPLMGDGVLGAPIETEYLSNGMIIVESGVFLLGSSINEPWMTLYDSDVKPIMQVMPPVEQIPGIADNYIELSVQGFAEVSDGYIILAWYSSRNYLISVNSDGSFKSCKTSYQKSIGKCHEL